MSVKKYVSSIVKRVKCSKAKREEIRQQLFSDISAAMENGESEHRVIARMGSAKEIAEEFNQNLPECEQKIYKKNKSIRIVCFIAAVFLLIGVAVYCILPKTAEIGSSGFFEQTIVEETTKQVITDLNNGDFESLRNNATEIMKNAITADGLTEAKKHIADGNWGDFQSIGKMYAAEIEQRGEVIAMVQVTAAYENTAVTYTISFDKEMKLAGFYMK